MLIFWSLVRNSVVLAVYLLFSVACFLTVHEHSLKECYETEYWLELFIKSGILEPETAKVLYAQCGTIRRLLISYLNTAKGTAQ